MGCQFFFIKYRNIQSLRLFVSKEKQIIHHFCKSQSFIIFRNKIRTSSQRKIRKTSIYQFMRNMMTPSALNAKKNLWE